MHASALDGDGFRRAVKHAAEGHPSGVRDANHLQAPPDTLALVAPLISMIIVVTGNSNCNSACNRDGKRKVSKTCRSKRNNSRQEVVIVMVRATARAIETETEVADSRKEKLTAIMSFLPDLTMGTRVSFHSGIKR